jgi:hypothetical protein
MSVTESESAMMEQPTHTKRRCCQRSAALDWFPRVRVLACTCLAVVASTGRAHAAAGQWQAGGRLGAAWLDGARLGPSVEGYLRHGLGDSLDFELQVLTSLHPFQPDSKSAPAPGSTTSDPAWALGLSPGVLYRWDVLRAVPFAGLGLGIYEWGGVESELNSAQFGVSGRLGLDYLLSRDVVMSVQASAHLLMAESSVRLPWFQLGVGAAHAWGW